MCLWVVVLLVSSWSVWSFLLGFVYGFPSVQVLFWRCLFQGLEKSLRLS
jgi:hypothetical protein